MKKSFKVYCIVWALFFALFNIVTFVTPSEISGISKYTPSFFVGYGAIVLNFVAQLFAGNFAFKNSSLQKTFYGLSVVSVAYSGLIVQLIAGGICMIFPVIPVWVSVLLCAAVTVVNIIVMLVTAGAAQTVSGIDDDIKNKTFFIRSLSTDIQTLMNTTDDVLIKNECKRVYEAVRYSDPMTNDELLSVESDILKEFEAFKTGVNNGDLQIAVADADRLLKLIEIRNNKIKLLK